MNTRAIVDAGFAGLWGLHSHRFGRQQDEATGLIPLKPCISPAEQRRRDAADEARLAHAEERDAALVRAIGRAFGA